MTDGEKAMGLLVALMGAALGQAQTSQYGVTMDTSAKNILQDEDVRRLLELEGGVNHASEQGRTETTATGSGKEKKDLHPDC